MAVPLITERRGAWELTVLQAGGQLRVRMVKLLQGRVVEKHGAVAAVGTISPARLFLQGKRYLRRELGVTLDPRRRKTQG